MKKPSLDPKTVIIVVLLLVIAGGAVYIYKHRDTSTGPKRVKVSTDNSEAAGFKSADAKTDKTLPAGTITPSQLAQNNQTYLNKDVKVRGLLHKDTSGQYYIVDQGSTSRPAAFYLTLKGVAASELDKYSIVDGSNGLPADTKTKDVQPVTVIGSFVLDSAPQAGGATSAKLTVAAIQP